MTNRVNILNKTKDIKEANSLLKEALNILNQIPNTKVEETTTYELCSKIEKYFRDEIKA